MSSVPHHAGESFGEKTLPARYLEVDSSLILSWAREGKLPGIKEKVTWRFQRATLDEWIANEKIR